MFPHIIQSQQFTPLFLSRIFRSADGMRGVAQNHGSSSLEGHIMILLFYEPSTRTRASFQMAMELLGGKVGMASEHAGVFSSAAKGETLEDTIRVICSYYPDVIVLRHKEVGAAERAADISTVPIINAGDGTGQHPTQALLDVYTIYQEFGHIEGIRVAMVGDLKHGRTARSLAYLLAKFKGVKLYFVAPPVLQMEDDIRDHLGEQGIPFENAAGLAEITDQVDVVYMTRLQLERLGDEEDASAIRNEASKFYLTPAVMDQLPKGSIIMHPLPRTEEIPPEIDVDPRAAYFRQAENGLYVRMALLEYILHQPPQGRVQP